MFSGKGLQYRFLLAWLLGAGLFSIVLGGFTYRFSVDRALRSGELSLEALLTAVEKTASIGAYTGDRLLLQEVVDGLSRSPLVANVQVHDAHGLPMMQSRTPVAQTDGASTPFRLQQVSVRRQLASPFDANEVVGILTLQANMAVLHRSANTEAGELVLLLLVQTVAIAFLLYLLAERFVSRPIVNLAQTLRHMQPGTGERLPIAKRHRDDEIGALIQGANTLLQANEEAMERERGLRAEMQAMERRYQQIFETSSAGIFVLSADGFLINCNPTARHMAALTPETTTHTIDFIKHTFAHDQRVRHLMHQALQSGEPEAADLVLRLPGNGEGSKRWVHCLFSVPRAQGLGTAQRQAQFIEGVMYDITDRKQREQATQHLAEHDPLTSLKNRTAARAVLELWLRQASLNRQSFNLLFIDLDGFKQINDEHGHAAGDMVLVTCAQRIQAAMRRESDLCARLGGDEFMMALQHTGPYDDQVKAVASGLIESINHPILLTDGAEVRVGVSVGIACYPQHGRDLEQLFAAADAAMYEIKRSGKNAFAFAVTA